MEYLVVGLLTFIAILLIEVLILCIKIAKKYVKEIVLIRHQSEIRSTIEEMKTKGYVMSRIDSPNLKSEWVKITFIK